MFLLHFIETTLENRTTKTTQITLNTQINPLEHTFFEQTINHIMVYVKTPVSEKETRPYAKNPVKNETKNSRTKKKIIASVQAVLQDAGGNQEAPHTSREK